LGLKPKDVTPIHKKYCPRFGPFKHMAPAYQIIPSLSCCL
jgi:hypothetical protein